MAKKWGFFSALFVFFISSCFALPQGSRTVTFKNLCSYPIWFGTVSGAYPRHIDCLNKRDSCPAGTSCYVYSWDGQHKQLAAQCYWTNPTPSTKNVRQKGDSYLLTPNGPPITLYFPNPNNSELDSFWSGAFAARTNCQNGQCETADCGDDGQGGCAPAHGFVPPASQAEVTFNRVGNDFYDIEIINGINVSLELKPDHVANQNHNYFWCGSPGAAITNNNQPVCSWQMQPPSNDYLWVEAGGKSCSENKGCLNGDVCGYSGAAITQIIPQKSCGKLLGYWTANQICGMNKNFGAPFYCSQPATREQYSSPAILLNLYQCSPTSVTNSCYQPGANSSCCGYSNWSAISGLKNNQKRAQDLPSPNQDWTQMVLPTLQWLKKACPTAYTYPFDDPSSTFQCRSNDPVNVVNYTVTFCPEQQIRQNFQGQKN